MLSKDSAAAALYEVWVGRLQESVFALYVPREARSLFGGGNRRKLIRLLGEPDSAFGENPEAERDRILMKSLEEAVVILKEKLGPDMLRWKWGDLHHMVFEHPLSRGAGLEVKNQLDTESVPRGGDSLAVNNTSFRSSDYRQISGASYRQIIDLGDWDNSFAVNSPGQSGDPRSSHYKNLLNLWAEGKYFPLLFTRPKIEESTAEAIILLPRERLRPKTFQCSVS